MAAAQVYFLTSQLSMVRTQTLMKLLLMDEYSSLLCVVDGGSV